MRNLILYILVFSLNSVYAEDWYIRWSANGSTWYEKWDNTLNQINEIPGDERFELLGRAVAAGPNGNQEKQEIYKCAQEIFLKIPGHATYYQDKIESMRAAALAYSRMTLEEQQEAFRDKIEPITVGDYERYVSMIAFPALKQLPSPETVAVLGHFLNDPEGQDGKRLDGMPWTSSDVMSYPTNAEEAVNALRALGIDHPPFCWNSPVIERGTQEGEVDAWKDWWNEIAAGKRTYRFIGSDVEYGPDGPVSKEVLERIRRDQKRDEERAAGRNRSSTTAVSSITETPKPWTIGGLIPSFLLCAGAVWYLLKGRRVA